MLNLRTRCPADWVTGQHGACNNVFTTRRILEELLVSQLGKRLLPSTTYGSRSPCSLKPAAEVCGRSIPFTTFITFICLRSIFISAMPNSPKRSKFCAETSFLPFHISHTFHPLFKHSNSFRRRFWKSYCQNNFYFHLSYVKSSNFGLKCKNVCTSLQWQTKLRTHVTQNAGKKQMNCKICKNVTTSETELS
jgi:hypothetical protein